MTSFAAARDSPGGRHLTPDALEQIWAEHVPLVIPLRGTPTCRLRLDPSAKTLALQTVYSDPPPVLGKLRNVSFESFIDDGVDSAEIAVRIAHNPRGAYALLTTIADELQMRQQPLAVAVKAGLAQHQDVLAAGGGLSAEAEIGLYGELLLLEHLIATMGASTAIKAWQGPLTEEHDFALESARVEVKTTSSERRRHVIHGLEQLVPIPGADLNLVSIQITHAGTAEGRSLPELIAHLRAASGGHAVRLDRKLADAGWSANDSALYPHVWTLRSKPRAYAVTAEFPALTPDRVDVDLDRIDSVSYVLDVTGLPCTAGPHPLHTFVETSESEPT